MQWIWNIKFESSFWGEGSNSPILRTGHLYEMAASSRRHNLVTGRVRNPLCVLTSTFLTLPSSLGWTCITRPKGQQSRGVFTSTSRTTSFSTRFLVSEVHFGLMIRPGEGEGLTMPFPTIDFSIFNIRHLRFWGCSLNQEGIRGKDREVLWVITRCW